MAAMGTLETQAAMVQDIYGHLASIGGSLQEHVSTNGITHLILEQLYRDQQATLNAARDDLKQAADRIQALEAEVLRQSPKDRHASTYLGNPSRDVHVIYR